MSKFRLIRPSERSGKVRNPKKVDNLAISKFAGLRKVAGVTMRIIQVIFYSK